MTRQKDEGKNPWIGIFIAIVCVVFSLSVCPLFRTADGSDDHDSLIQQELEQESSKAPEDGKKSGPARIEGGDKAKRNYSFPIVLGLSVMLAFLVIYELLERSQERRNGMNEMKGATFNPDYRVFAISLREQELYGCPYCQFCRWSKSIVVESIWIYSCDGDGCKKIYIVIDDSDVTKSVVGYYDENGEKYFPELEPHPFIGKPAIGNKPPSC